MIRSLALYISILLTSLSSLAQSQTLKVSYSYADHSSHNQYDTEVLANDNEVLSYAIRLIRKGNKPSNYYYTRSTDSTFIYKNTQTGSLIFDEWLGRDYHVIQEELSLFNWTITTKKDTILGFPCKQAVCEFRGREYVALFTDSLPFTAAPWKIHGLDGIVLKVFTNDEIVSFEATAVDVIDGPSPIYRPFAHKEPIDYNKFCKHYKDYIKDVFDMRKAHAREQNRKEPELNKVPRIEIIIPENQFILMEE